MAETLVQFQNPVLSPQEDLYEARACASEVPGGLWQGWIEFTPIAGGKVVRSGRETTQPNRRDAEYWAGGLTMVYLQGALRRALAGPVAVNIARIERPAYHKPAPSVPYSTVGNRESALDPFAAYSKGEFLFRRRLGALSDWHLVNIALAYELTHEPIESLNRRATAYLIELIVNGVRERQEVLDR